MSATNKTIQLILSAKDQTSKVLGKIGTGLKQFGKAAKVAVAAAGAAFLATTAAIGAVVAKTLDYGDSLGKTADKLGLTTEALSGMRHAGELAGVSVQGMDNSVKFMNKNLSDAVLGTGEAKVAFEQLGLSAEELKRSGPEKAFEQIVSKLEGVENASDRVNYAMKIFGKSGGDILNMTAKGLREAKEEANEFGLSLSRADAKKMEDVNDSITRIKSAFGGAGIALTTSLLDPLKAMAARLVEMAKNGTLAEWGTKIGEIAGTAINWFTDMVLGVGKLDAVWNIAAGGFGAFVDMFATGMNKVAAFVLEGFGQIAGAIDTLTFGTIPGLDALETDLKTLATGARAAAEETGKSWQDNSDKVSKAWDTLNKKSQETKFEQVADGLKKTAKAAKETVAPVKETGKALEETAKQAAKAKKEAAAYELAMEKMASNERIKSMEFAVDLKIADLKADADKAKAIIENIGTSITSTGNLLGDLFGQLKDTNNFTDRWALQDQIDQTSQDNKRALDDSHKAAEQQHEMNQLKIDRLRSGDAMITVQADGLEPELRLIWHKVLETAQVEASNEQAQFLLGI